MRRKAYTIEYKLYQADIVRNICVIAGTKEEAWDKATYEVIPDMHGECPYSAWCYSVTYNNGNYRRFNNHEGNPF